MPPPPPVAPISLLPVIAATDSSIPLLGSHLCSPPSSPSLTRIQRFAPPCTPPRKRIITTSSSPEEEFSLFTPREMNTPRRGPSIFESPSINRSPSLRSIHRREATPPPSSEPVAENDSDDSDDENLLERELNSALEEAGTSSPAIPTDIPTTDDTQRQDEDEEDESSKPFWPGLPPSSPPPPSSPMLYPVSTEPSTDNEDDFELPVVSSDFDIGIDENQAEQNGGLEGLLSSQDNEVMPSEEVQFDDDALAAILEMITSNSNADSSSSHITNNDSQDILKDLGAVFDDQQLVPAQNDLLAFPLISVLIIPAFGVR
ncbi:hypothetical protein BT96DRAFT_667368 [Gymnopus androsaceus JB14]|uniref:Uncharacterized protein n=1 Tax=Gymnopus androsaceus JB14 TaxID=1447944 RepID=A0A6A4I996_9AGAR|nr:hypothetical protein BT96DRAFT_667368 [Gymnopus androsaceus JB14]